MATTPAAVGWGLLVGAGVPGFADAQDGGGGSFPNAWLLLDALCGEGEACLERVPGMVGALSRVQPGSAVAQPPRAAGTSRGIRRAQLSPCGCIDIKVYIRCLLYARPKLGLGGILQKISQSPLL